MAIAGNKALLRVMNDYCFSKGILMINKDGATMPAPTTVLPSVVQGTTLEQVKNIQMLWADLVHTLSNDRNRITDVLGPYRKVDPFVEGLMSLYDKCPKSKMNVNILRVDYLHDSIKNLYQLVEYNTIACSFGSLGYKVSRMHEYLGKMLNTYPTPTGNFLKLDFDAHTSKLFNNAIDLIKKEGEDKCMVFVVPENERNIYDQHSLALRCFDDHKILSYRMTMQEVNSNVTKRNTDLYIGNKRVHLFYFRSGYSPLQYNHECWKAREKIENSSALSCPSLAFNISTFKAFQAHIYLNSSTIYDGKYKELKQFMPKFLPLNCASRELINEAISNPNKYVLKSHREGGGNNYYGPEISKFLTTHKYDNMFIMDKISTPECNNFLFRNGEIVEKSTISEMSIFSGFRTDGTEMHAFNDLGYLIRTKSSESGEGGVAMGHAVIDSPYVPTNPNKIVIKAK